MGAIVEGFGKILGGNAEASAYKERASELKQQAQLVQTQAKEQMATRTDQLNRTLGLITAMESSRGVSLSSPSAQAYAGDQKRSATIDTATLSANAAIQAGLLRESSQAALLAARNAQVQGWFSAIGSLENQAAQFASLGAG